MTMDFDYLNYVTSTKLKKVNAKNVKSVSHLMTVRPTDEQIENGTYKLENKIGDIF